MKTLKERIKEYLDEWEDYVIGGDINEELSFDIEKIVKENYVEKEFVRWFAEQDEFYHCIIDDEEKWYIPDWSTNILPRYLSFDELYDHWKREVKSKQDEKSL